MSRYHQSEHRTREKNVTGSAKVYARGKEGQYRKVFPRIEDHAGVERNLEKSIDVVPSNKAKIRETMSKTGRAQDYQNIKAMKQPKLEIDVNVKKEKPLVRQHIMSDADYVSRDGNLTIRKNGNSRSKRK